MPAGRTPLWMGAAALGALSLAVAAFVRAHAAPAFSNDPTAVVFARRARPEIAAV